jgi:hypothetical protein
VKKYDGWVIIYNGWMGFSFLITVHYIGQGRVFTFQRDVGVRC